MTSPPPDPGGNRAGRRCLPAVVAVACWTLGLIPKPEPEPETGDQVTEPDPIAALAAQLEELRGQLARYTGETGHLRAKLAEDSGQVVMLRLEIKKLGEKIEAAIARRKADEPPAPYWLGPEPGGARGPARRAAGWVDRVGLRPVPRLLRQAAALLGQPPGGGHSSSATYDRVGPDLRRPGEPGPCQDALLVPRALAARLSCAACAAAVQVRRGRLPAGAGPRRGSDRRRATPDRPEGPGRCFPGVRGLLA